MLTDGDVTRLKMKLIEYQRLASRHQAGRPLNAEEVKRLAELKASLAGWSIVDLMTAIPGLRFSSMPMC